jgi:SAM-dependent methyltransferase
MADSLENDSKKSPEFDQYAPTYATLLEDPLRDRFAQDPIHFHRRKWHLIERLLRNAGVVPGAQRWLDVGCGQGELLKLAGENFANAIGCDPSPNMLLSNASFKTYQQPSPVKLPFSDGSVDFVTAVCVFHHVHGEDRMLLIKEMRRVLSPGGWCCIIEHNPWNPITRSIVKRCPVDVDAELLTAREAAKMLETTGFASPRREYFLYLPEALFEKFGTFERVLSKVPLGGQYALLAQLPL